MKKSFLILGVLASIVATNAYARVDGDVDSQTVRTELTCPVGCELREQTLPLDQGRGSITRSRCYYINNNADCGEPTYNSSEEGGVQKIGKGIKKLMKNIRGEQNPQSTRTATTVVPQKVVYKEIYFDDSVDVIEAE